MAKKSRATAITKRNIEDAFWSYYCEIPMDKIRINAVMERSGYNRGTFYEYFKTLDEVLYSIEERVLTGAAETVEKIINSSSQEELDLIRISAETTMRYKNYLSVLLSEKGDSSFAKKLKDHIVRAMLPHVINKLNFTSDSYNSVQFEYLMEFIGSGVLAVMFKWITTSDVSSCTTQEELDDYFKQVVDMSNEIIEKVLTCIHK